MGLFSNKGPSAEEAYAAGVRDAQNSVQAPSGLEYVRNDDEMSDLLDKTLRYDEELKELEIALRGKAQVYDMNTGEIKEVVVHEPMMNERGIHSVINILKMNTKSQIMTNRSNAGVKNMTLFIMNNVLYTIAKNTQHWEVDITRREALIAIITPYVQSMLLRGMSGLERQSIYKRTTASEVYHKTDTSINPKKSGWGNIFG